MSAPLDAGTAVKNMSATMSACCTFWISSFVMSVSVEGVSALVAEFVGVAVLDFFLAAVGAFVDLVHTRQIDELCVSTRGTVVCGEELVEGLNGLVNAGEVVHVLELTKPVNLAEYADGEVSLVVCVIHVSEVFVDEGMQEELVLNLGVVLVSLEQVTHFGDIDHEVRVNFALHADAEEVVLCHVSVCSGFQGDGAGDFLPFFDGVDAEFTALSSEACGHRLVVHEGDHVEDDVLAIHPCANTQGVVRLPSVFVGGVPSLLEGPLELLPQDLWVCGSPLHGAFVKLNHGDGDCGDHTTHGVAMTRTPRVGRHLVVVQGSTLVGVACVPRGHEDGVTSVCKGATIALGNEVEVRVLEGFDVFHVCVYQRLKVSMMMARAVRATPAKMPTTPTCASVATSRMQEVNRLTNPPMMAYSDAIRMSKLTFMCL